MTKRIAIIAFEQYVDMDLFIAWDLFSRIGHERCQVEIVAGTPSITSVTGITIKRHAPLERANTADAVYFCSGGGTRALADDAHFLEVIKLDESHQILAAVDSGSILLGRLGHLRGRRATTYPTPDLHKRLVADGAVVVESSLVIEGNVATASQCLAGVELVRWVIMKLFDQVVADATISTALPLGSPAIRLL
jgi:putative intracellular protease/amidase